MNYHSLAHWRRPCRENQLLNEVLSNKIENLLNRYTRNILNKNEPPTIGVDYYTKSIVLKDGAVVKAKMWDTGIRVTFNVSNSIFLIAGSEKYKAITTA